MPPSHKSGYHRSIQGVVRDIDLLPIDPDLAPDDSGEPSSIHHPGVHAPHRYARSILVAIFLGGSLGTLARYGLLEIWATRSGTGAFPHTLFLINLSGAFFLGLILTVLVESTWSHSPNAAPLGPFLTTGFLGGWTTYSSFVLGIDVLGNAGHVGLALIYLAVTLLSSLALVFIGMALGRLVAQ